MTVVILWIECAECRGYDDETIIPKIEFFPTLEEAKVYVEEHMLSPLTWRPHPLGGEYYAFSSGETWISPIETFAPTVI